MNKKTITENSFFLHRNMKINSYGSSKGYPLLVIPTQDGTADDYESFGMIETLKDYIDNNIIHVFCVDSVDKDSFSDIHGDKEKRIQLQEQYFNYINKEVVTYIHRINHSTNRILLTGNSMGGYHSANLFLRNPQTFEGCICLSGVYDASYFFDGWMNDLVRLNSPVHYLQDMKEDDPKVKLYQDRSIILNSRSHSIDLFLVALCQFINIPKERRSCYYRKSYSCDYSRNHLIIHIKPPIIK